MKLGAMSHSNPHAPSSTQIILSLLLAFTVAFASSLAWKVSDVDFAAKLGADYLGKSYILTAIVLFVGAAFLITLLRKISPQEVFFTFQKYSLVFFGIVCCAEALFHISHYSLAVFAFKVFGSAYSSLIINTYWISLDLYNKRSKISISQYTFLCLSTYVGIATAGCLLQSSTVGASQFGIIGGGCSFVCWLLGKAAYTSSPPVPDEESSSAESATKSLLKTVCTSRAVLLLVIGSILLNVLVSSTEYSVIADFETRFMSTPQDSKGYQTIGSFVTLIGLGNTVTLFSTQICHRYNLGHAGVSFATVLAFVTLRCGFSEGHSLLISALALVVLESLYPLIVESNLARLLDCFSESQRISARALMQTLTEPAGLILSAGLLKMSWVTVSTFGIGVIVVAILLTVFSYTIEGRWMAYFSMLRQKQFVFAARLTALLVFCQAVIPWIAHAEEMAESLWIHENQWIEPPF